MSFLVDTNVVSEWAKPRPNAGVIAWAAGVDEDRVFLSVVTLAELRRGVERMMAPGARRRRLEEWLCEELRLRFEGRVLAIDAGIADRWGTVVARGEAAGQPIGTMDTLIAATAEIHALTLVTRNAGDFAGAVSAILNPWDPA